MENLEQLFASLAISSASFVGKAAFSLATNVAIKKISSLVFTPSPSSPDSQEFSDLQEELSSLLLTVNPAMDFLELKSGRMENSSHIQTISQGIKSRLNRLTLLTSDSPEFLKEMRTTIAYIKENLSCIHLSLTLTQSLNNSLKRISLVKVIKASNVFSHPADNFIGSPISIKLYTLFLGSARKHSKVNWSWKEEYAQGYALLKKEDMWTHQLYILESLDDDLYHEPQESKESEILPGFPCGNVKCIATKQIQSFYFTSRGQILQLHDSQEPTLVLKCSNDKGSNEWIALEEVDFKTSVKSKAVVKNRNHLDDLELWLRLGHLEWTLGKSHLDVDDETLTDFLTPKESI